MTYATPEETASIMRPATEGERWLHAQLDIIAPHRHEQGHDVHLKALELLAFKLRDHITGYKGEAKVMRNLLEQTLNVLETIEPDDDSEHRQLKALMNHITAVVDSPFTVRS